MSKLKNDQPAVFLDNGCLHTTADAVGSLILEHKAAYKYKTLVAPTELSTMKIVRTVARVDYELNQIFGYFRN